MSASGSPTVAPVRWGPTLAALVVMCVALTVWHVDERHLRRTAEVERLKARLFSVEETDVTGIEIRNPRGEIAARLVESEWRLVRPLEARGDADAFRVLLQNFVYAVRRNEFDVTSAVALTNYGLDDPRLRLTLEWRGPKAASGAVLIGDRTSTGDYYAMREGEKTIFVLSEHLKNNIDKTTYDLRDKRVFAFDPDLVTQLDVDCATSTLTLARSEAGWRVERPAPFRGDKKAIANLLSEIGATAAMAFIDATTEPLTTYGLDPPRATVAVTFDTATTDVARAVKITLQLGRLTPGGKQVYAATNALKADGRPQVVALPRALLDVIARDQMHYRDRAVFTIQPAELAEVHASAGHNDFTLVRDNNNQWNFKEMPELVVDQEQLRFNFAGVLSLRVKDWVTDATDDLTSYDLDIPKQIVTLKDESGELVETLAVGRLIRDADPAVYARVEQRPAIFTLPIEARRTFFWSRSDFLLKKLFAIDPRLVSRLVVHVKVGESTDNLTVAKDGDNWTVRFKGKEQRKNLSAAIAEPLMILFADVRYDQRVFEKLENLSEAGLTTPVLTMTAYDGAGVELGKLERGANVQSMAFVRLNGREIFRLKRERFNGVEKALRMVFEAYNKE